MSQKTIPENTATPLDSTVRRSYHDLVVTLAHPSFSDRRFWTVQAMVVAIFFEHIAADLGWFHHEIPIPDLTVMLLLFIPIIYAGNVFGLVGSFGAALTGITLTVLDELLIHHRAVDFWGEWAVVITASVVAIQVGHQYELERHQREQLRLAGRNKVEIELRTRLIEVETHKQIARSAELFRGVFENNTSGMFLMDEVGYLMNVNRAFCEMIGFTVDELIGLTPNAFIHPDDFSLANEEHRRLTSGEVARVHYSTRYLHRDGRVLFGEVSTACITNETGRPDTFVVSVRDATDERALLEQLELQALYDPLTGLANRTLFEDRLSRAQASVARNGGSNAVFLLDLDDFKEVNDTFGHHVGDELLVEFARRMERVTRASDTLCRFGGDEFLYLAEGLTRSYEEIAERLLSVVSEPFDVAGTRVQQRVSIGVVALGIDAMDNDELLRNVDTALYEAKRQGRGRFVLFTSDMHDRASSRFELLRDLRNAVGTNQLSMKYQPLVDLATSEIVGFEALMRWQHPVNGFVAPDVFIPVAEQTDLIFKLGEFAIREATLDAASWAVPGGCSPYVSVNLSTNQFRDLNLLALMDDALTVSGLAAHRLVFEVTERAALADSVQVTKVLKHLEMRGVRLALDDFGTGYSSLSHLSRLHPHIIKIDRSFVIAANDDAPSQALLEAIISLGRRLKLTVLAEGIETEEQLEYLKSINCELGQGYLFSPAVSAIEARDLIASQSGRSL